MILAETVAGTWFESFAHPENGDEMRDAGTSDSANHSEETIVVETPGVCGGKPRVGGTRIPVWGMELHRRLGYTADEIAEMFPSLERSDVIAAWRYAQRHPETIDAQIRANEE